ncbi:MAG: nucleotidyltransferase family protein, partial [Paludibacteraceae bacterium]|nr:nucleotidyltransferase family protein [Paludibacteraceae bacterium]
MILDELTYEQCLMQGVGPMVFPARLEKGIDPANSMRMKAVCMQNMQTQAKLQIVLERAWKALEKAGIKPVLMKGAGLAALYPDPSMRQWGDIDLFVGKEQYHPACAVMRETFPKALKFDEELDHYKHYNIIADGVSIETHRVSVSMTHPMDVRRYAKMEAFGVKHASELVIGDLRLQIFEPTFNVLFVFLHSWEHMMSSGASIRQLCDLALLLHTYKEAIDARLLRKWLKALHLYDVWQLYAYNLVQSLGYPRDEVLFYTDSVAARAEKMMADLLAGRMDERLK